MPGGGGGSLVDAPEPGSRSAPVHARLVTGAAPLRVGMFSPYSLTIPGGVQNQVMALARTLRATGIEVRVLGPCDGPPPATFVTPLGNSLPTAANGSIAPLAPDPSASLRTIRALRDEQLRRPPPPRAVRARPDDDRARRSTRPRSSPRSTPPVTARATTCSPR